MPLDVQFLEDGTVLARAKGLMTYEDVITGLRTVWEDPMFVAGARQIMDLRELRGFEMEESDFRKIISEAETKIDLLKGGLVAIFAPTDFSFGMMRMYEQLAESIPAKIKVFRRYDDALAWLDFHGNDKASAE